MSNPEHFPMELKHWVNDKTTNQQTNQLTAVTTVLIKGHKKGVVNLFFGMTWPTDPMGKLKWN